MKHRFDLAVACDTDHDRHGIVAARDEQRTDGYPARANNKGEIGRQIVAWRRKLEQHWLTLRFGEVAIEIRGGHQLFDIQVFLNDLDPLAVRIELYADGIDGAPCIRQEMQRLRQLPNAPGGYLYSAAVPAIRPATDYTVRAIPYCAGVAVPGEEARILWQR